MTHRLSCDNCGDDISELREIERSGWGGEITCSACFRETREAENCEFKDFPLAQGADE